MENVKQFNYIVSVITNGAGCTRDIKSRVAMAKASLEKKDILFPNKLQLKLGN
jgi:hypothetical protein